jgi:hypothetical protein
LGPFSIRSQQSNNRSKPNEPEKSKAIVAGSSDGWYYFINLYVGARHLDCTNVRLMLAPNGFLDETPEAWDAQRS